jgi:hypothetical protein
MERSATRQQQGDNDRQRLHGHVARRQQSKIIHSSALILCWPLTESEGVMTGGRILRSLVQLAAAASIAASWVIGSALPAAAECSTAPRPTNIGAFVGVAFEATVTSASRNPTVKLPDAAPFDWEVRLHVSEVFRGSVPRVLVTDGWTNSCSDFQGSELQPGDRILITTNRLDLPTLYGHVLAWRSTASGWRFDDRLIHPHDGGVFPSAAVRETTKSEILALVGTSLPSTDASEAATRSAGSPWAGSLLLGPLTVALFERRRRSKRTAPPK